jgi:inosine-uridine nucleoside N-ribohydrolase
MPKKIIIDTDPGVDDSMAILMALHSPELEVVGLTTIWGNAAGEVTALNGLRLVELEGNDHIPVAGGSNVPLVIPISTLGTMVHGVDGMGNTNPPPPHGKLHPLPAAQFIVETVLANPGEITLVPVGPLTNIALALTLEPKIASLVKEVVIMGGSVGEPGNISPVAEANIYHDPQAADIVFAAGWPVVMVGLNVTHRVVQTRKYLEELTSADSVAARFIARILPCYQNYFDSNYGTGGDIYTHDPSALAYAIDSSLFKTESWPVFVETHGRCIGQTVADIRHQWESRPPTKVCTEVNSAGVLALIKERLT